MITPELLDYIGGETAKRTERSIFWNLLKEKGWTDADLAEAIDALSKTEAKDAGAMQTGGMIVPAPPSGKIRDYFAHFSANNMLEFSIGMVLFLSQIGSITYLTYFVLLTSSINVLSYILHFLLLILGIALFRGASHRAQIRYIDAIVGQNTHK